MNDTPSIISAINVKKSNHFRSLISSGRFQTAVVSFLGMQPKTGYTLFQGKQLGWHIPNCMQKVPVIASIRFSTGRCWERPLPNSI